ncbi:MAG: MFS transporter [Desulfuromonadales bacterium C00003094]|jgi:MFS family permease|nr:MAG: MFS transporter [Desulfuromonadales bacterium C00003094]OEU73887.1 MAG: MFS transporter [Desulfuromonadales bacterium C00003107]
MPLQKNISKLYIFSFLKMTLFPMAIITLFWKDQIGLTLTDILLLQAIFSVASVIFEYPSGYLSDRLGYRTALILACLLAIGGWSLYTLADSFTGVLLAEIILGGAWAFISGSDSALLFETLRTQGQEEHYARFDGRMTGCAQTGEAAGALFAGVMYAAWPLLPFVGQIGLWIIGLGICLTLVEPEPEAESGPAIHSHLTEALHTCRYALLENRHVRATILFGTGLGIASFYAVWLIQPYMQQTGVPIAWFGPVWAGANLTIALCSLISQRLHFAWGHRGMAALFIALIIVGYAGLSFTAGVWGFLFYYLLTAMRGLQGPIMRNHLQRASRRSNRASILSLHSLAFRILFVVTGPLVGLSADHLGLRPTFGVLAILFTAALLPGAWLFLRTLPETAE